MKDEWSETRGGKKGGVPIPMYLGTVGMTSLNLRNVHVCTQRSCILYMRTVYKKYMHYNVHTAFYR